MANEPVYVTFEFRGNLEEEVNKVTLGIKGLRDESAKTFQRLVVDSNQAFGAMSAENRKLAIAVQENKNVLQDLAIMQKALDEERAAGNITTQQHAQATAALAFQESNLRNTIISGTQILNERMQTESKARDSITALSLKVRELTETYYNLSKADRDGATGQGILKQIGELDKQIGQAHSRLSQYTKSTGTQFNSLGMSIQQVARELPSLTMGANMFFLAISNNLPILADNLRAARIEYEALKNSGQTAIPVWKQVLSSLISWQTALVVGITLLTVYGKDIINWIQGLFGVDLAQKRLNESMTDFNSLLAKEQQHLRSLFSLLGKTKEGTEGYRKAINAINTAYGKYLPNLLSEKSTLSEINAAYQLVNKALRENAALKAQSNAIDKVLDDAIKKQSEALTEMRSIAQEKLGDTVKSDGIIDTVTELTEDFRTAGKSWEEAWRGVSSKIRHEVGNTKLSGSFYEELEDYVRSVYNSEKQIADIQKQFNPFFNKQEADKAVIKNKEYYEGIKQQATSVLEYMDAKQKELLDDGKTDHIEPAVVSAYKDAKAAIDEATKALKVYDSYDKQDSEENKVLRQLQNQLDAAQKLTEKQKQIEYEALQFDQEMEQKRIDLKDESFKKRSEQSDLNYQKELLSISQFASDRLKTLQEAQRLEWEQGGKKGTFTPMKELPADILAQVEAMKEAALAAYKHTNDILTKDMDAAYREERLRFQDTLQQELSDIETNYAEKIKAAKGHEALLAEITKNKQIAIKEATGKHTLELIEFYKELTLQRVELVDKQFRLETDKRKEQIKIEKKAAEDSLRILNAQFEINPTTELEKQIAATELQLQGFNKELEEMPVQRFGELLSIAKAVFNELGQLEGEIGEVFSGMASQIDNIWTAFDKTASTQDKISAGLNGLVSVINVVTSATKKRKEVEKEFYKNAIAMAHEYALALNEQLRLQSELSGSGFVTDYVGQIKDGFAAMTDAQAKYDEALEKLNEGKAKVSLRNSVDWGNVGKGAAGGAAAGAVIGSVIPVIGTAIGAVVGAIGGFFSGLFGGKKKKETFGGLLEVFPELVDSSGKLNKELAQSIINTDQVDDNTKQLIQNALDWADAVEEANKQIKEIVIDLAGDLGNDMKTAIVDAWKAGEDASKKMFDAASRSLEGFIENILYSAVFADVFDEFGDRVADSLNPATGDGDVVDDYDWLMQQMDERDDAYIALLEAIKKRAADKGFDMWVPDTPVDDTRTAKAKGITSMSQDSADQLIGSFNALLIFASQTDMTVTNINTLLVQGLTTLNRIARNTDRLENIEKDIHSMQVNILDMVNRGLLMRK